MTAQTTKLSLRWISGIGCIFSQGWWKLHVVFCKIMITMYRYWERYHQIARKTARFVSQDLNSILNSSILSWGSFQWQNTEHQQHARWRWRSSWLWTYSPTNSQINMSQCFQSCSRSKKNLGDSRFGSLGGLVHKNPSTKECKDVISWKKVSWRVQNSKWLENILPWDKYKYIYIQIIHLKTRFYHQTGVWEDGHVFGLTKDLGERFAGQVDLDKGRKPTGETKTPSHRATLVFCQPRINGYEEVIITINVDQMMCRCFFMIYLQYIYYIYIGKKTLRAFFSIVCEVSGHVFLFPWVRFGKKWWL